MSATDRLDTRDDTAHQRQKLLVFTLGNLRFGLKILDVEDIIALAAEPPRKEALWRLSVSYGSQLPVVDLRARLQPQGGRKRAEDAERYFIVVVKAECFHKCFAVGLVVERMAEVVDVDAQAVEGAGARRPGSSSVTLGAEPVSLLDLEQVLGPQDEAGSLTPGFAC